MELLSNVKVEADMGVKISTDSLTMFDKIKLTLANFVADLFKGIEVFTYPRLEGELSHFFTISNNNVNKSRRLAYTSKYEYGFTISYVPKSPLSMTEIQDVSFLILQNITDIGTYQMHSICSEIKNNKLEITGIITVNEMNIPTDPIIMKSKEDIHNG